MYFRIILLGNFFLICEETQISLLSFQGNQIQGVRLCEQLWVGRGRDGALEPIAIAATSFVLSHSSRLHMRRGLCCGDTAISAFAVESCVCQSEGWNAQHKHSLEVVTALEI